MNIVYYNKIFPENIFYEIEKCEYSNNIGIFECGYFLSNLDVVRKSKTIKLSYNVYSTTMQHYFVCLCDCEGLLYKIVSYACPLTKYDEED